MSKQWTRAEVSERNAAEQLLLIIDNRVYDVTRFQDDHPGGHEVLQQAAGRDASEDFADVGHSLDAKELMAQYCVGELPAHERRDPPRPAAPAAPLATTTAPPAASSSSWLVPVAAGLLLTLLYSYFLA